MTHDEEEDESAWLGPPTPRDEELKGEIGELLDKISSATGIPKKELEGRSTRPITKKEKDPDYDPDFDDDEEIKKLDSLETKEEAIRDLTELEKELEEKRRRLLMTPSEREAEDAAEKKRREEEYKLTRRPASGSGTAIPPPPTGTPTPIAPKKIELGECCVRMRRELLEKTNVQWWNDHKGNKLIAFSHTYLKLLHCPWCGAKL